MQDKFIATSFGKIHAKIAGAGNPIILIHGYSPELNSWRTWEKNIDALAASGRVYALDLIGYGGSDKPDPPLDVRTQANVLIQLMDAERMASASLVGLSWGGAIVQMVAGLAPNRIRKLVLVDSGYDETKRG